MVITELTVDLIVNPVEIQPLILKAMKTKLYFLFLVSLFISTLVNSQLAEVPITIEMTPHYGTYNEPDPICGPIDLTGYVTYDIYLVLQDSEDELQAIFGMDPFGDGGNCVEDSFDLNITSNGSFFQHVLGSNFGYQINCDFLSVYPTLQWDSFLTINKECNNSDGVNITFLSNPLLAECENQSFLTFSGDDDCDYFDGGNLKIDSNAIFNQYGIAAEQDHKILVARMTTNGDLCFNFGVQLLDQGTPGDVIFYNSDYINMCQLHPCNNFPMTAHTVNNNVCDGNSTEIVFQEGGYGYVNYNVHNASTDEIVDVQQFVNGELNLNALSEGEYYVSMIDSVGCRDTSSVFMVQAPEVLSLQAIIQDEISCVGESDGSIQLVCSGGEMPYTLWHTYEDGIAVEVQCGSLLENLSCGMHLFELSDSHGCSVTASAELVCPSEIQIDLTRQNLSCFGAMDGSVAGEAMGGTGNLKVTWIPSDNFPTYPENQNPVTLDASGLPAGVYLLVIEDDHECQESMEIEITEPEALQCVLETTENDACASTSGGTPGYSYQWSDGSTSDCIEDMEPGIYTVQVWDENGCTISASVEYNVSVHEIESGQISIYPNPAKDYLFIETSLTSSEFSEIEILDMEGRVVRKNIRLTENGININELATGFYSLRLHTAERVYSLSFVKQ